MNWKLSRLLRAVEDLICEGYEPRAVDLMDAFVERFGFSNEVAPKAFWTRFTQLYDACI